MPTKFIFHAFVTDVFERRLSKHVSGHGPDTIFLTDSAGWYVRLGNELTLYCGNEKPGYTSGDKIILTLERSQNADANG